MPQCGEPRRNEPFAGGWPGWAACAVLVTLPAEKDPARALHGPDDEPNCDLPPRKSISTNPNG